MTKVFMAPLFSSQIRQRFTQVPAITVILFLILVLALWLVYRPGLSGPYVFDDFHNVTRNPSVAIDALTLENLSLAAFSNGQGGAGRPIAMTSFALNYHFAGSSFSPVAFKLTNLVIHVVNALLVFFLARTLFRLRLPGASSEIAGVDERRAMLAAMFAAALWALHPLQLTSVLYTVQRMTSMSALFMLAGLLVFLHGRRRLAEDRLAGLGWMAGGLTGGVLLGVLCKENAALLPLLVAAVELFFFSREELSARARRRLRLFYLLFVAIPVVVAALYLLLNPEFVLRSYASRNFTLVERLLTESRVLFFYLSLIFLPLISKFGLYHDDFALSTGLLDPPSTLLAIAAWMLIAVALVAGTRRRSLWAFGTVWFLAAHAMESTLLGLELIHEHRNYVPSIGLIIILSAYLAAMVSKLRVNARAVGAGAISILLVFSFVTYARAHSWSSRTALFESMVRHHPDSYRALTGLAAAMREQERDARAVYKTLRDAARANPSAISPLVEMQKTLQALIPVSEYVAADVEPQVQNGQQIPGWARDPVLNRDYLTELDREVAAETLRRLSSSGTHIETVYALWTAQTCALDGRDHCVPLVNRMLRWHLVTLEKLPPGDKRKGRLELSAAKLFAARGDIDDALAYVDLAIETMSGDPRYRAQKALLLIKLGAIDEAERIADAIENEMDWLKAYVRDVEFLRREIHRARTTDTHNTAAIPSNDDR